MEQHNDAFMVLDGVHRLLSFTWATVDIVDAVTHTQMRFIFRHIEQPSMRQEKKRWKKLALEKLATNWQKYSSVSFSTTTTYFRRCGLAFIPEFFFKARTHCAFACYAPTIFHNYM